MHLRRAVPLCLPLWIGLPGCQGDPASTDTSASSGVDASTATTGETSPTTGATGPTTGPSTDGGTGTGTTSSASATSTDPTTGATGSTGSTGETDATDGTGDTDTTGGGEGGLTRRPAEPIVMIGGQLPGLAAAAAGDVVGFAWRDGAWTQVAVQVDERVRADFCTIYAKALLGADKAPCKTTKAISALFYADPKTYTGADTDPKLDLDDEVVFMARDAGGKAAPGSEPAGVIAGSGVEVAVADGDETGWVYLFERSKDGGLEPGAGVDLVSYALKLVGDIDYLTQYPFIGKGSCGDAVCDPPVLEDSVVASAHYERHFSARWVTDRLRITTPDSTGTDILDIAQARFAPDFCGRHVLTFSTSEGAFVANIDGPVRAIRSYLGANSGPLTQRTHLFYDRLEVVQTFLRVHPIPAIMDLVDYSADAPGMTYYNQWNEGGLAIDGVPDPGFDTAPFEWELVSGPHGSVVTVLESKLSQPLATLGYYEDDAATPNNQCEASNTLDHPDDKAIGTSGMWIVAPIPGTDPRDGDKDHVFIERSHYYEAPDLTVAEGKQRAALAQDPPKLSARAHAAQPGEVCGDAMCGAEEAASCPQDCNPLDQTCGDGLCDPWENSVSCEADCGTGMVGSMCGDEVCDPGEHALSCAGDCWSPAYEPLASCLAMECSSEVGACNDEIPCVDRVVCVAECVGGGGMLATCQATCTMQIPATTEQANFAKAVLACGQGACV